MAYSIQLHPEVGTDLIKISDWYAAINLNLVGRFNAEFDKLVFNLERIPRMFEIVYNDVRIGELEKFPYLVHYQVDLKAKVVFVLAVLHKRENQDKVKNRL